MCGFGHSTLANIFRGPKTILYKSYSTHHSMSLNTHGDALVSLLLIPVDMCEYQCPPMESLWIRRPATGAVIFVIKNEVLLKV